MAENPLVSVVVPTHNRPAFLRKTIQSILDQTYPNLEIIIVSNGMSHDNKNVVKEFKDPRLIYADQENSGGPASPRNNGIRLSNGKYIAFCDDDDLWMPDKIEKQVAVLEENTEYGLCYTKMLRFDETREWSNPHEEGPATFESLLYVNTVPISSVCIRKSLVDEFGKFSESKKVGTSEDYEFLLRHAITTKFRFLDDYLVKYWSGDDRTTSVDFRKNIFAAFKYTIMLLNCYFLLPRPKFTGRFIFIKPGLFHFKNAFKSAGCILLNHH